MNIRYFILTAEISYHEMFIKFKDDRFCLAFQISPNLETIAWAPK